MSIILHLFKIILFPLIIIYRGIIFLRNWLYDRGIFSSTNPNVFTINVGNLTVGGTGKTPQTEYLINLLSNTYKTTLLSRGYGRITKGFGWANEKTDATMIGDEPLQIFEKYKNKVNVAVCEKRVEGIEKIQKEKPDNQIVILDDAFQHRAIRPHLNILLSDYNRPFYSDSLLPFGRLRDIKESAKRADVVVVSKCPERISLIEQTEIKYRIRKFAKPNVPIFFSTIEYCEFRNYKNGISKPFSKSFVVIEGIANAKPLLNFLGKNDFEILKKYSFKDHHRFNRETIHEIINQNPDNQFLTTEKDFVKIRELLNDFEKEKFFYLPIEVKFDNQDEFDALVLRRFKEFQSAKSEEKL